MSLSGSHKRALWDSTSVPTTLALALSPDYDTPQLHDRDGGSNDDDDDESGYGADIYDDDILYHMKEVILYNIKEVGCSR